MGKKKFPHESLTPELAKILSDNRVQFYTIVSDKSPTLYQDLVTLIDSPRFIAKVIEARKRLNIENIPFKNPFDIAKITKKITLPKGKENDREWFKRHGHKYFIMSLMDYNIWGKILQLWHRGNTKKLKVLRSLAYKTLEEIDRPWYYTDATMQTILLGMCGWSHTGSLVIRGDTYIPEPTVAIIVNPRTTNTDVKLALHNLKNNELRDFKLPPPVNNIETYQYWYWEKLKGKTYAQIAWEYTSKLENELTEIQQEDPQFNPSKRELSKMYFNDTDILKGVNKYSSLLVY